MTSPYAGSIATPGRDTESETPSEDAIPRTRVREAVETAPPEQTVRRPAPAPAPAAATTWQPQATPPVAWSQPQPAFAAAAPQPTYQVIQQPRKTSAVETLALALLALLVAAAAGFGAYSVTAQRAPTEAEVAAFQRIAEGEGVFAGRISGYQMGRQQGIVENREIARYQGLIAQAEEFNRGWKQGMEDGRRVPQWRGYGGARGGWYNPGPTQVQSALASAQVIANRTGAPVDVEIY